MNSLVPDKVEALAEGSPALLADVGLLPVVDALVPDHVRAVDESLPAVAARVRLLPRVNALMLRHVRIAFEAPVTGATLIKPPFSGASSAHGRASIQGGIQLGHTAL